MCASLYLWHALQSHGKNCFKYVKCLCTYKRRGRIWAVQCCSPTLEYINNSKVWILTAWKKKSQCLTWDCSSLCMQTSSSWLEAVWCSRWLWVNPGGFCLPCLLPVVCLFTLFHSVPAKWRTVSHLVRCTAISCSLLSQSSPSILCIRFYLASCAVLISSTAFDLCSARCKPLKGMPSGKQDTLHILKYETTGTCAVCSQQCKRSCFVATQVHRLIQNRRPQSLSFGFICI